MANKKGFHFFNEMNTLFQKNLFLRSMKKTLYYTDGILLKFSKKPKIASTTKKKKVLVLFNLGLGDAVVFRCSALKLRKLFPKKEYELTLTCQNGTEKIFENDQLFDHFIPVDYKSAAVNPKIRMNLFKQLRKEYYDVILDPVGIRECNSNVLMMRAACGKEKIGITDITKPVPCPPKIIQKTYTKVLKLNHPGISLLEFYSSFFEKVGDNKIPFHVGFEKLNTKPSKIDLPKKYFIVFPNASMQLKRWHIDRFCEVARRVAKKTGWELVLLGTKDDKASIDEFKKLIDMPYVDLVDKTNLNDYFNIIDQASFIMTNDTSAYHIALMEQTPVAIITGGYTYDRFVIYDFERKDEFLRPCTVTYNMDCFNCENRCPYIKSGDLNWPCLEKITVEFAWEKIEKFLDELTKGGTHGSRKTTRTKK